MVNVKELQLNVFNHIKELYHTGTLPPDCLGYTLLNDTEITEENAKISLFDILLGGVTTSSVSLYIFLLLMATHPKIQMKMYKEISECVSQKENQEDKIVLNDQPNMPYTRACLFEVLRYASVTPLTFDHTTLKDTEISGHRIPKGMPVYVNLFGLHHNNKYWDKPWDFNPKRFLDDKGNLVASDHMNRKRMMTFGAGPRACIGQSFALARLFILTTSLMRTFKVTPVPGETIIHDPRKYEIGAIFNAPRTRIGLMKRQ